MKLINYLWLLPTAAFAAPAPRIKPAAPTSPNFPASFYSIPIEMSSCSLPDSDSTLIPPLSFPVREAFATAAVEACHTLFSKNLFAYKVEIGGNRIFTDIKTYDGNTRPFSFEIMTFDDKFPGQRVTLGQCISAFTEKRSALGQLVNGWGRTEQYKPCWAPSKNKKDGKVEVVRDWRVSLHKDGFGDVWFRSFPGF